MTDIEADTLKVLYILTAGAPPHAGYLKLSQIWDFPPARKLFCEYYSCLVRKYPHIQYMQYGDYTSTECEYMRRGSVNVWAMQQEEMSVMHR